MTEADHYHRSRRNEYSLAETSGNGLREDDDSRPGGTGGGELDAAGNTDLPHWHATSTPPTGRRGGDWLHGAGAGDAGARDGIEYTFPGRCIATGGHGCRSE